MTTPIEGASTNCYCSSTGTKSILGDIQRASIPGSALVTECCWRTICRVRAQNPNEVEPEVWVEICTTRANLGGFSTRTVLPDVPTLKRWTKRDSPMRC